MAINVDIKIKKLNSKPFPKFMYFEKEGHETIVYFKEYSTCGTLIYSSSPGREDILFIETDNWGIQGFKDFEGEITLSNK